MPKKKLVSFIQPNFQQGPKEFNAYYLPYSAGVILAYAFDFAHIQENWHIDSIVWRREDIEILANKLCHNHILAISTYVWNRQYNYALGRRVKELNPKCLIIVGGPEPAITDPLIFEKQPWIDILVKLEGEISFKRILEQYPGPYENIPGLLLNKNQKSIDTGNAERIQDLDKIQSPYLAGIFDKIIAANPHVTWNATLETNRGCPYQCTFCDWGSLTYNKVKKFGINRVFDELEWIGQNCGFVTITDANFGMFVERDNLIVDKLIEVQTKYKKLSSFSMTWAKNQRNEVVDIVKKLIDKSTNFGQGLTVSVQSMEHSVLENIKRKNLDQHKIDEIFKICDQNNIPVYTELILGLPGETEESWKSAFWKIFEAGNHTGINILQAQLLENAAMNLSQKADWSLESVAVYDYMSGSYGDMDVAESVEVVIATRDISRESMLDLFVWNTFIQTFHINGLTTYIARYLHKAHSVSYQVFYDSLYKYIKADEWFCENLESVRKYYYNWTISGKINHPPIGNVEIFGWNLVHSLTLKMQKQKRVDYTFSLIQNWLLESFKIDKNMLEQIVKFQQNYFITYDELKLLPKTIDFDFDFLGFLVDGLTLENQSSYTFDTVEDKNMSIDRFLENIYFARKRNFGKALIKKIQG